VVEYQRRSYAADGSAVLTSRPVPDMAGAQRFTTEAVLAFRDLPDAGGCQVGWLQSVAGILAGFGELAHRESCPSFGC
jgi:hypothetical protein